jgi:outer membrane protein OmpA-like peptidoglycan-associated protein
MTTGYWLKEPDPTWRFWWKGAVPAGVLSVLAVYTLAIVAYRTQSHVQLQVTQALQKQGLSWVNVHTQGLDVSLSGLPPSLQAARQAERFAREAKCDTWVGALPCMSRVRESFARPADSLLASGGGFNADGPRTSTNAVVAKAPEAEAPVAQDSTSASAAVSAENADAPRFYDLKIVVSPLSVRFEGDVPDETTKTSLQQAMGAAWTAQSKDASPQFDNQLRPRGGMPEANWDAATKLAVAMAARCNTGYVALRQTALSVDCETETSTQRTNLIAAGAEIPPGVTVASLNVLALDEIQHCEEELVKLVSRSQIRFITSSASLLPGSRPLLREIAHQLERCPGVVVVEGHTDAQGVREENLTLSLNRARAVVASLVGYGVAEGRVRAEGFGPDKPLATNENATGRAQNRRIEFRVARSSEFPDSVLPASKNSAAPPKSQ